MSNRSFEEIIKVKRNLEKERILKLKNDYQEGKIDICDISNEDLQILIKVYDIMNAELEQKIKQNYEKEKRHILEILKQMNNKKN